jgi:hypothetical protein
MGKSNYRHKGLTEISSKKDRFCEKNFIKADLNVWKAIGVFGLYSECKYYSVGQKR